MAKSEKQRITREVLLSDSVNNWQDVVYRYEEARRKRDYKFWDEMWNQEPED